MIYRRFGYLQSRLLLEKQDELRKLEVRLDAMDVDDAQVDPDRLQTRQSYGTVEMQARHDLLTTIEDKWLRYVSLLQAAQGLVSMNKPTEIEHHSVWNWLEASQVVNAGDARFIKCKEDLITLRPGREHAWLDSTIETLLRWSKWSALNDLFRSQGTRDKSDGSYGIMLYTRTRIERAVVTVITLVIVVLLILPIYFLHHLTEHGETSQTGVGCLAVLLVFTMAFSVCISLFTRAKRNEILAASAAYCAVLVVFLGNVDIQSSPNIWNTKTPIT